VAFVEDENGKRTDLSSPEVTFGRDVSNDVALSQDMRVSRSHAKITQRDGQRTLIDLDSKNGTFVNNRRIVNHPLRDGDLIRIGSSTWRFSSGVDPFETEMASHVSSSPPGADLSEREREVLKLVSDGLSDKDIGQRLHISVNTVRSHLDRIGEKSGLRKRAELTRLAIGLGLDEIELH
jgi:pSer/pThr/pTyr-binding forkhead associated (FHA) protein